MKKLIATALLAACVTTTVGAFSHASHPLGQKERTDADDPSLADAVLSAVDNDDVALLRHLFAKGAQANFLDNSRTALIEAAEYGHVEAVRFLLAHGAEVNYSNDFSITSLWYAEHREKSAADPALRAKYARIIRMLKKAGATEVRDGNVAGSRPKLTPGKRPVVQQASADPERLDDAVMSAATDGNVVQLRALFAKGATANFVDSITPLIAAAADAHVDAVRFLLAHGAGVNGADPIGNTALDHAEQEEKQHYTDPGLRAKYAEIIAILKKGGGKT